MQDKENFVVSSPVDGLIKNLSVVPDEAFSQGFLGPGLAIDPSSNIISAPFSGKIQTLHKALHAVVIENNGVEVLIHIGVETVALDGKGFKALCKEGAEVKKGEALIEFDREFIKKNAPSNLVIVLVASPQDAELKLAPEGEVKAGGFLYSVVGKPAIAQDNMPEPDNSELVKKEIVITAKNGLHARPAAAIAKIANGFNKTFIYISKGGKTVNAKSMVEILSLGINFGDKIEFSAKGESASQALEAVIPAAAEGHGGEGGVVSLNTNQNIPDFKGEVKLNAQGIYPGLVIGLARHLKRLELDIKETADNAEAENKKLSDAIANVNNKIKQEIDESGNNHNRQEILKAHLTMLEDPFITTVSRDFITEGKSAAYSWQKAVGKSIEILESSQNELLKERKADYKDIEGRVLREILGCGGNCFDFPPDSIVITDELLSSELSMLNDNIKGIIMSGGSQTSHIAIMLKNISLPSEIAAGPAALAIPEGSQLILDSSNGTITVNPVNLEAVKQEQVVKAALRAKALEHALEPAITKDGTLIEVKGNIGNVEEAEKAASFGSDGLGLVRSEFLFSGYRAAPSEEEQYQVYQQIADTQKGKDIIIRTFDVGGDKPLPFFPLPKEANPIVGLRGVRNYPLMPDLFRSQVRAIMRVTPHGTAKIMLPMISFIEEVQRYKDIIKEEQAKLGIKEVSIGIMVEVPSTAVMANMFAGYVDFMSLGTNDLTQYTLAIDRGNTNLSILADPLTPAVLKLMYMTAEAGKGRNISVGVCGAVASDIQAVPLLLGLGLKSLSVSGGLIADVKYLIRTLDINVCRDMALKALNMPGAAEVRAMVKENFKL